MRTNFLLAGFTVTALFSTGTAFGADPRLLNLVMPDATTMAGANVTNAEITPFGQYVLGQITSSAGQELQTFVTATGFDPRHDVSEILAASSGNATTPSGIVLAIGNFQVAQITSAIAAKSPELTAQNYGGATLISSGANPGFSMAFLGANIAVVGDTPSVKAAIDRSTGVNSINPALATQVQALSTTEDAWAVTSSSAVSLLGGLTSPAGTTTAPSPMSQFGQMFNSIQSSSGGIKFGTNVQITGQAITSDASSAQSLAGVLQALVSIVSMAGTQDPQVAQMALLLQGLKVTADGTTLNIALSIPETQIESILNTMNTPQAKPAAKPRVKPVSQPN